MHEPIQRGFESLDGLKLPINECHIVLALRQTADGGGRNARISMTMQLKHMLGAI